MSHQSSTDRLDKIFQPDSNGPDDKVLLESIPDTQHFYLYHDDPDGDRVGRLEVSPANTRAKGTFDEDGPLIEWALSKALTGYKYSRDYRLRCEYTSEEVILIREMKQDATSRSSAESHGWKETGRWTITHDDVTYTSPETSRDGFLASRQE